VTHRAAAAAVLAAGLLVMAMGVSASAGEPVERSIVFRIHDVSLEQLLTIDGVRMIATDGGAALLAHAGRLDDELEAAAGLPGISLSVHDVGSGTEGLDALEARLQALEPDRYRAIWIVSEGSGHPGDELGAVVASALRWDGGSAPRALTSDSTRRDGVVVAEDIAPTLCDLAFASCDTGGSEIGTTDASPPIDLHGRYLANRRMSVPIQAAAGIFVTLAGLLGVVLLVLRDRVPPWLGSLGAWIAISVVPLAVALLVVGHLDSLSYATVVTFVVGATAAACLAAVEVARRWGTMAALAALGAATILLFVLEAALGWTAAMFTFLGGTELDGGRFYGLPNVEVGLLLGASVYVAFLLHGTWTGVALIAALALFAGLPFAGANLGAAVTLAATAGLWWGFRGRRGPIATAIAGLAAGGAGLAIVLVLNRVLPGPPTHITNFVEGQGGGVLATVAHRLRTGLDLIARNPFAIVPVIGVPATLLAVLRPATPVRASFDLHPGWREALLTILWGGVIAYVANDTGAAALGLAFGTGLGGLLFVSLRDRPWMMEAP
jgi:hypothetical protein